MNDLDIPDFKEITEKMEFYLSNLKEVKRCDIGSTLKGQKGIYIFYEDDTPVYVGKTDNLKRRLTEHCNVSSKNNDANFAFKIAKQNWLKSNNVNTQATRKDLEILPDFLLSFTSAKEKVSSMKIKYVYIENPYEQYLFEFYASLHFKTKYNDFKNH